MDYKGPWKSSSVLIDVLSRDIPTDTAEKKNGNPVRTGNSRLQTEAHSNTNPLG
jgi:hypothetical protein